MTASNGDRAQLEVRGVDLWFGGTHALDNVSLEVQTGELLGLIGPNGAGKTSLLNCLSGFYRPTSGEIHFDGHSLAGVRSQGAAKLGISRTFQNVEVIHEESVLDNVLLGRHRHMRAGIFAAMAYWGRAAREEHEHRRVVEQILSLLDLTQLRDEEAGSLTWAQQKVVEIARAVAAEPRLLLLDEPTSGMSAEEKSFIAEVIRILQDRMGLTQVIIEHDVGFIAGLCDRIVVLDFGRVIAAGSPEQVLNDEQVIAAYVGVGPDESSP